MDRDNDDSVDSFPEVKSEDRQSMKSEQGVVEEADEVQGEGDINVDMLSPETRYEQTLQEEERKRDREDYEAEDSSSDDGGGVDDLGEDFTQLKLKPDHENRPLWVTPTCRIFVETHSLFYQEAYDLLIAIATPICRPSNIHEYALTPSSLQAAVSVGITVDQMISVLDKLSKVVLDERVKYFIRTNTEHFGKVSLYLKENQCFLRISEGTVERRLLNNQEICDCLETEEKTRKEKKSRLEMGNEGESLEDGGDQRAEFELDADGRQPSSERLVKEGRMKDLKNILSSLKFPILEEYDYIGKKSADSIDIDLKPETALRPYQIKSLAKMFANHVARSGVIVLPCGAGKTMVGVTATHTVKQSTVVLCNSAIAVDQWKAEYERRTTIDPKIIFRFTSEHRDKIPEGQGVILITTYSMITFGGKRSKETDEIMASLRQRTWGLMVLDEVHVVPAKTFQGVTEELKAHCKLGLTATLVREDNKISELDYLIGPKLYEANWLDLVKEGHIADVSCFEIWCKMTPEFYQSYLEAKEQHRQLLCVANPNKFMACQYLIDLHLKKRDKILVFSDNLFALKKYAERMKHDYIMGSTPHNRRMELFHKFNVTEACCLFLSKVGDVAVDVPSANVVIQISSHGAARRQEAQRLGRILRKKAGNNTACFYSLVSQDTREMYYSTKRQQFLVDQGYSFKVVPNILLGKTKGLEYSEKSDQIKLLEEVTNSQENEDEVDADTVAVRGGRGKPKYSRQRGSMQHRSGAGRGLYAEIHQGRATEGPVLVERRNNLVVKAKRSLY